MTTHEFSFSWVDREIIYGFYLSASFFIVTPFCGLPPNGLYYLRVVRARHHEGIKSQARIMLADGEHTTRQVHTLLDHFQKPANNTNSEFVPLFKIIFFSESELATILTMNEQFNQVINHNILLCGLTASVNCAAYFRIMPIQPRR